MKNLSIVLKYKIVVKHNTVDQSVISINNININYLKQIKIYIKRIFHKYLKQFLLNNLSQ